MPDILCENQYCNAAQCPKLLWLQKNKPEEYCAVPMDEQLASTVKKVKQLALSLFADRENVSVDERFEFNSISCHVDVLVNGKNNSVELYEIKSATHVKATYIQETAYKASILASLGYDIKKASVLYINKNYVRKGKLDIHKMFVTRDITKKVLQMIPEMVSILGIMCNAAASDSEPQKEISINCMTPYKCGYSKYCFSSLPTPNVFDVSGISLEKKFELLESGVVSYSDLEKCEALTEKQLCQVKAELHGLPPWANRAELKKFLQGISYPLYFLDFETYQSAIPEYEDTMPFLQIPFQYSLHYMENENGKLCHKEFLADIGVDPRRTLAEQLVKDIPQNVCVLAYNMMFEKTVIKRLAEQFSDLSEHLMNIHGNIKDLMEPFRKKHYYDRRMNGSYSIKSVLPALFPDDPELDYSNLEQIHNGGEAMLMYCQMQAEDDAVREQIRQNLLKYCCLDTYAMVKILQKLNKVVEDYND